MKNVQDLVTWLNTFFVKKLFYIFNDVFVPFFLFKFVHEEVKNQTDDSDEDYEQ